MSSKVARAFLLGLELDGPLPTGPYLLAAELCRLVYIGNEEEGEKIEGKEKDSAQETHLLGEHGEDEVGVLLRQEIQLSLRALHEALAGNAAGADRDFRLEDMIAG